MTNDNSLWSFTASQTEQNTYTAKQLHSQHLKQQILMYKTTVYRLVNGDIAHQKQQISEKDDIMRQ